MRNYPILNKLFHRLSPLIFKIRHRRLSGIFSISNIIPSLEHKKLLVSSERLLNSLIYKDETWYKIKNIGRIMQNDFFFRWIRSSNKSHDNQCENLKTEIRQNDILINSKNRTNDWIFLTLDQKFEYPILIEFELKILSEFTELQFAFNFQDIGQRYRFNLRNNKVLSFEVVKDGFFHNHIIDVPLSFRLNEFENLKICLLDNQFLYLVNNHVILNIKQDYSLIDYGKLAFILWDRRDSNINAVYRNINIYKI